MKHLSEYLAESVKEYAFRIKLAMEPSAEKLETLKVAMQKFGLKTLSAPKKTIIQKTPVDFQNINNVEVFILDAVLTYPTTVQVLEQYIANCLGFPQSHVRVVSPNNPGEQNQEEMVQKQEEAEDKKNMSTQDKIQSARLSDPNYKDSPKVDHDKYYGDKYNEELVKKLKAETKDTTSVEFAAKPKHEFGPFDFLKNKGNPVSPIGSRQNKLPEMGRKK